MAPLTWRNVDAPNFSGANEMWKVAANLMNTGIASAQKGLSDFRDTTTAEQSSALMAQIAGGASPAALLAGANPAFLSPDAISFANKQADVLQGRETQALRNVGIGLENAGRGLNNTQQGIVNQATQFKFDTAVQDKARADADRAALPGALSEMDGLRDRLASNDPAVATAAQAEKSAFISKNGALLGLKTTEDLDKFALGTFTRNEKGMENQNKQLAFAEQQRAFKTSKDAEGLVKSAYQFYENDPDKVNAYLKGRQDLDPDMYASASAKAAEYAKLYPKSKAQSVLGAVNPLTNPTGETPSTITPMTRDRLSGLLNKHEGAGDPDTLYGHVQKKPGQFNGIKVSESTIGELKEFSSQRGSYGQAMRAQQGPVFGTPMGENQIVGRTLAATAKKLGLDDNTVFTPEVQRIMRDKIAIDAISGPKTMAGKIEALRGQWVGLKNASDTEVAAAVNELEGKKGNVDYVAPDSLARRQSDPSSMAAKAPQYEAMMSAVSKGQPWEAPIVNKPQISNSDGTISTEKTITTEVNGSFLNIPTIVDGKELPEDKAMEEFRAGRNPAVGAFPDQASAVSAAEARSAQIGATVAQTNQATATQNADLTKDLTKVDNSKDIVVNENTVIPGIDPSGSKAKKDIQTTNRNMLINNAVDQLAVDAGSAGGGKIGQLWDYFASSEEDYNNSNVNREKAKEASDFYKTETAKQYFRANPQELTAAANNPAEYAKSFGQTPSQKAAIEAQKVRETEAVKAAAVGTPAATPPAPIRNVTPEEGVRQEIAALEAKFSVDSAVDQYAGFVDTLKQTDNETPAQTVARITGDKGVFQGVNKGELDQSIEKLTTGLGINSKTAAGMLEYAKKYKSGWLTQDGFGSGFTVDLDKAKEVWKNFQNGGGEAGLNPAVSAIKNAASKAYQKSEFAAATAAYDARIKEIEDAIADKNTSKAEKLALKQELTNTHQAMRQQLQFIGQSGDVTGNMRSRTGK